MGTSHLALPDGPFSQQTALCSRGDALIYTRYALDMGHFNLLQQIYG
jgi:hypothetical protein